MGKEIYLLHILFRIIPNFQVSLKNIKDPDDNFNHWWVIKQISFKYFVGLFLISKSVKNISKIQTTISTMMAKEIDLLQILLRIIPNFQVSLKNIRDPDDNFNH